MSNATTAETPRLGTALRRLRMHRRLELADAAAQLGIPTKTLRALEWDRYDLLGGPAEAELIEHRYAGLLGVDLGPPAEAEREAEAVAPQEAAPPRRAVSRSELLSLLVAVAPLLVLAVTFVLADVPLHTLLLLLLASLLLVAAALPPRAIAWAPVSATSFARYRERLGLAALGILVPVVVFTVLGSLT